MNRVMKKPDFCICENKGADQLRGNRTADQCLFLARLHKVQKSYCSHPGRTHSHSRSTLLKFSRSLYLDNQLSESIHTWAIGTI